VGFENFGKIVQFAAAALGIPAAAAGTYSVYQTYFTNEAVCQKLRVSIIATMERNVAPDAKRTLLQKDVAEFERKCADADPDAHGLFQAAIRPVPALTPASATPAQASVAAADALSKTVAVFGKSSAGEMRGWVALIRSGEVTFEGHATTPASLPPPGTILNARQVIPVWREPLPPGPNDPNKLQGRLPTGACVRVVATRPEPAQARQWGEVAPVQCP
jgi:hypothetical protein